MFWSLRDLKTLLLLNKKRSTSQKLAFACWTSLAFANEVNKCVGTHIQSFLCRFLMFAIWSKSLVDHSVCALTVQTDTTIWKFHCTQTHKRVRNGWQWSTDRTWRRERGLTDDGHAFAVAVEVEQSEHRVGHLLVHLHDGDGVLRPGQEHKPKVACGRDQSALIRRCGLVHQLIWKCRNVQYTN